MLRGGDTGCGPSRRCIINSSWLVCDTLKLLPLLSSCDEQDDEDEYMGRYFLVKFVSGMPLRRSEQQAPPF